MELVALVADPVTIGTLAGALALVMFAAAWHKLSEPELFEGALAAYRLLPPSTVGAVARGLPLLEAALGIGILVPATRSIALVAVALLLLAYAAGMGINLVRGRRDIDCGCGGDSHPLAWSLVLRNLVLVAAAVLASGPTLDRDMAWTDAVTLVLGILAFYGLYLMVDELLRQAGRLARTRDEHLEHGHES